MSLVKRTELKWFFGTHFRLALIAAFLKIKFAKQTVKTVDAQCVQGIKKRV